jgi:hypothetical protein
LVIRVLYTIKGCIYETKTLLPLGRGVSSSFRLWENTKKEGNVKEKGGKTKDKENFFLSKE